MSLPSSSFSVRRPLRGDGTTRQTFRSLHLLRFVLSLGIAIPVYVNSSYLAGLVGERGVGFTYAASSVLAGILFFLMPKVLSTFGNYALAFLMVFFLALSSFEIAALAAPIAVAILFVGYKTITSTIAFPMDAFIEERSSDDRTGEIRGAFMAVSTLAFLVGPLVVGVILKNGDYWKVYLASSACLVVALIVLFVAFRHHEDPPYDRVSPRETIRRFLGRQELRAVFAATLLLRSFVAFSIIYVPLFLHGHAGFSWPQVSAVFSITLLPGVLLTAPIGRLADRRLGEKELMLLGFVLAGSAVMVLPFLGDSFTACLVAVMLAQIGTTLVELTGESYFFKQIDATDADMIGFFRIARPIAYFVVPLSASLLLAVLPLPLLFVVFGGAFLALGLVAGLRIRDTR